METGTGREGVRILSGWRAGAGTETLANGDEYVGGWKDDKMERPRWAKGGRLPK